MRRTTRGWHADGFGLAVLALASVAAFGATLVALH